MPTGQALIVAHALIFIGIKDLFFLIFFFKMVSNMAYYLCDTEIIGVV